MKRSKRKRLNRNYKRNRAARDHLRRLLEGRGIEQQMAADVAARVVEQHRSSMAFDEWLADEVAELLWASIQREKADRELLELVDSHYSGSLDHRPPYVALIRGHLGG